MAISSLPPGPISMLLMPQPTPPDTVVYSDRAATVILPLRPTLGDTSRLLCASCGRQRLFGDPPPVPFALLPQTFHI